MGVGLDLFDLYVWSGSSGRWMGGAGDTGAVDEDIEVRGLEAVAQDFGMGEQQKRNCTVSAGQKKDLESEKMI